jgi:DNA-binding MarR family transcriptional regulator
MPRISRDSQPFREPVRLPEPRSNVGFALRKLMQTFRQLVDSTIRARGMEISFPHFMVLKTLAQEPGLSGAQLARRTSVTAQSMNGLLRGMESTGMIVREKHPENRRTDAWFMTRSGLRQVTEAGEIADEIINRMLAAISKADATRLAELLNECATALQDGAEPKRGARLSESSRIARS